MRRAWATEATARRAASIHTRVGVAAPPTGWVSPCRVPRAGGRLRIVPSRETGERLLLTTTTERSPPDAAAASLLLPAVAPSARAAPSARPPPGRRRAEGSPFGVE